MLTDLRESLVADLGGTGLAVHVAWPDRPAVPCLIVVPGGQYVSAGQLYGDWLVRLDVIVLVARDSYPVALANLDTAIDAVLTATGSWGVTGIDQPSLVTVGAAEVLGVVIQLQHATRL
jgi:hypothetical protein